jgi:hypothetical protein
MTIYSTAAELDKIKTTLSKYARLPFSSEVIPGAVMEAVLANVRGARVLKTYDYIDVLDKDRKFGWQVKSTMASTPVTWKRAKIPNSINLINASKLGLEGCQLLGNAIIDFCNTHAHESMSKYGLVSRSKCNTDLLKERERCCYGTEIQSIKQ